MAGYCSCKEGDNFVHVVGLRAGEPNKLCLIPKGGHSEQFKNSVSKVTRYRFNPISLDPLHPNISCIFSILFSIHFLRC